MYSEGIGIDIKMAFADAVMCRNIVLVL